MSIILKGIKLILNILVLLMMLVFIFTTFRPVSTTISSTNSNDTSIADSINLLPYILDDKDIVHESVQDSNNEEAPADDTSTPGITREEVLKRAEEMTEVKWTSKYNLVDKKGLYIFRRGQTYTGIPYTMDGYQVTSAAGFLSKINKSKTLYGNDCSGFVSAVWGISRQTTLSLYNAVKQNKTVDGIPVHLIAWEDLKPGDALLLDNGKGKGHIMLFIDGDTKNKDKLYVYEQNIATIVPYEPIPVARKDTRSREKLQKEGYIPIRLMNIT